MDKLSPEARSRNMGRIRSRDTSPEIAVRSTLHRLGLRYALYRRDLPGRPDIVFSSRRACVFVHGCFWHGCPRCIDGTRRVKSNVPYWSKKIEGNRQRDARHALHLRKSGWKVFVLWECQVSNAKRLEKLAVKIKALPLNREKLFNQKGRMGARQRAKKRDRSPAPRPVNKVATGASA